MSANNSQNHVSSSQTPHKMSKAEAKRRKGRFKKDTTTYNVIVAVLTVLANITVIYTMMNTTQFSSFSKSTFILINVLCLILLLVLNFLVMMGIRTHKKSLYISGVVMMCIFLVIGSVGTYTLFRVNSNISKITSSSTKENVSTSFVVYSDSGTQTITEVSQLEGAVVGLAAGTSTATLGQNRLSSEGVNVTIEKYDDYSSELLALFNGEIKCAILPTNYQSMFSSETGMADYLTKTASILDFEDSVTVQNTAGNTNKDLTTEPFTVLLIGNADGLSDTMILCSVNPISMKITMSSIPRDSYVPITCYNNNSSKLNSAHASSRDCLINTIQQLTGVTIDYYVDTNFQGVVDVVDALGGIVVDSPVEFIGQTASSTRGTYTVYVPAGDNVVLNGEQALAFARERYAFATGDFARQEHQQTVIKAIIRSIMRTKDVNTFLKVFDAAGDNIQTNFTIDQLSGFVSYAMKKINRYYDQSHVENVFNIVSSRVTGYNSGIWDEGLQLSLSIVRLYQGSLDDTKTAIDRNINLDSEITADKTVKWSVNWDFTVPSISQESYNEAHIESTVPTTIGNYVGKSLSALQSWASNYGITVYATDENGNTVTNGTITSQDVAAGTSIDSITAVYVTVTGSTSTATPTPTCGTNATYNSEKGACVCNTGYTGDGQTCTANAATSAPATQTCPADKPSGTYPDCYAPITKPVNCDGTWNDRTGVCTCTNGGTYDSTNGCTAPQPTYPDPGNCDGTWDTTKGTCTCTNGGTYDSANGCAAPQQTYPDPGNCDGTWDTTKGTCSCTNQGTYNSTDGCVAPG